MEENTKVGKIKKRFELAKQRKSLWDELYEEVLEFSTPHRDVFNEDFETPGQDKMGRNLVFDSTAQEAHHKAASNIQSSLVPPMKQWMKFKPGPLLEDEDGIEEVLENIGEILFANLHNSNFDTQIAESILDLIVGTGALLVLKGDRNQPFRFVNVPLTQLFLEEGANGVIDTAFRYSKIKIRNIEKTWEDAELDAKLKERLRQDPAAEVKILEATMPKRISVFDSQTNETRAEDGYEYVVLIDEEEFKVPLVEREQKSSPWVVFRWSTIPGEIYGRGPLMFALPDIKTLNKTKELLLESASIAIFGMYTVEDDGIINLENIEFGAGAMIPVDSNGRQGRGPSLQPLATPGDPNLAQIIIEDLRNSINEMLFANPLGPVDLPVKSATEVSLRQQELSKRIGSAFGKLQFELITPLVNRCLDILDELGLIDLGPFRVDGNVLAIQHVSPLALAQEEEELIAMTRLAETTAGLYGPEALTALMPPDRFVQIAREKLNIPVEAIATEEEIEAIKNAVAQAAQQPPPEGA